MELPVLTRRSFLKATAITGMTAAVGGSQVLKQSNKVKAETSSSETKVVRTCCRACIARCGVLAHVKNGRVIKLEGDPDQPMSKGKLCAKGLAGIQALYHPNRNKYPMKRVGERGENNWKRISWDEALDTIADKLLETKEKYGAETVFGTTGGGGNPEFMSVFRFMNVYGSPNVFEPGAAQCYMPRTLSNALMYGSGMWGTNSIADSAALEIYFEDTPMKTLVLWGTGPSCNSPAQGGRAIAELRAKGLKTVSIDPRFAPDATKADVWLPIRPGTDVALMLAWIRYIIEHKLYDEEFVIKWTNLPFLVNPETKLCLRESDIKEGGSAETFIVWDQKTKSAMPMPFPWDDNLDPALEGAYTVNDMVCKTGFQLLKERAEEYTLEKAAEICWLDVDMIEKALKLYTENTPSGISHGVATDQNPNSVQAAMGALTIDFLMGNVENPGNILQDFPDINVPDGMVTPLQRFLPEEQFKKRFGSIEYKGMLNWGICHYPTLLEAIKTGKPYKPRVWMERSGNKLAMMGDVTQVAEAIHELDFVVHAYMYPTSFSMYADILIPVTEWLETDLILPSLNTAVVRQQVVHTWETMNETIYWAKLAKRLADKGHQGFIDAFDPEKTFPEPAYWDTIDDLCNHYLKNHGMTYSEYKEKVPFEVIPMNEYRIYRTFEKIDPETKKPRGFSTPSKKLEAYGEPFIILGRTGAPFAPYSMEPRSEDYDPLPYYMEPDEGPLDSSIASEYPLVMTNGRIPYYHHGTLRNIPYLRELYPVPEIWIHPTPAKKYGVSQDDWVWVESKRGKIRAKAYVTKGINQGVVYMERFWLPENLGTETNGWQEMNVNVLSKISAPFNDIVGTVTLRGYQVKVSKADGPPKGVWYKPEEFKPWLPEPTDPTELVEV
ncbi:molybdopterin-dependent oxidoreductase [Robertmurraya massiliosenegalensis]|uniref:molybdopterin-dependent oxidoreductase n=1 Tax=Robertmurraya TaxID=2837507 RepID=UPI0039A6F5F6